MNAINHIQITDEMRDRFIDDCIAPTKRREFIVLNRDLRDAYQEWLHRFEGRTDYPVGNPEARLLYNRIQAIWGGIIENPVKRGQHVGMILLPLPTE